MGIYLNSGNIGLEDCIRGDGYVDKSNLIRLTNASIGRPGENRIVVSRPRRFGKTMALSMLNACYSRGCDSRNLFHGLAIEGDPSFGEHLNRHNVIELDVQEFYLGAKAEDQLDDFPGFISEKVTSDLADLFPEQVRGQERNLPDCLAEIYEAHHERFTFLLDEWDVVYRDEKGDGKLQEEFTRFLVRLFADPRLSDCVELAYLTGIFPIPKQAFRSGLTGFRTFSALGPAMPSTYFGFTEAEVQTLCQESRMPFQELKDWYEGYAFGSEEAVYCPWAVDQAVDRHAVRNYWKKSGSAAELRELVSRKEEDFRSAVKDLMEGIPVSVTVDEEGIDLTDLKSLDALLTALIHMGYLSYREGKVRIPCQEVRVAFTQELSRAER